MIPTLTLTISRAPDGRISVAGPIHDKFLCYGLLESGRDAINEAHAAAAASPIVAARAMPDLSLTRNGG